MMTDAELDSLEERVKALVLGQHPRISSEEVLKVIDEVRMLNKIKAVLEADERN